MEKYKLIQEIGEGTSGNVYKAHNVENNEIVAIKKMKRKFYFWEECMNLREAKSLRKLNHPNIVMLKEIVRENHELFFIFEHMDHSLYQVIRDRQNPFTEHEIRSLMSQVLQGLAYMHKTGYFHRDLKPENLLVTHDVIKIADFGLARDVMSEPPYTDYVSTRWYRAPEVLLKSSSYTPAIDMWAVGAILAELFMLCPLFPGESEIDQIFRICSIIGTPDSSMLSEGMALSHFIHFNFFKLAPINLSDIIPNASLEAIDLILKLCSWDPQSRPTAEQSLQHPFFHVGAWVPCPLLYPFQPNITQAEEPNLELNLWDFGTESDECFLGLTLGIKPNIPDGDSSASNLTFLYHFVNYCSSRNGASQQPREEFLFYRGYENSSSQSVFWPLLPSDPNINNETSLSSLPSAYRLGRQTSLSTIGVQESPIFTFAAAQPNLLDNNAFGQMMSLSLAIPNGNLLD